MLSHSAQAFEGLHPYSGPSETPGASRSPTDTDEEDDDLVIMDGLSAGATDGADGDDDLTIIGEVKPHVAALEAGPGANGNPGKRHSDADLEGPRKRPRGSQ